MSVSSVGIAAWWRPGVLPIELKGLELRQQFARDHVLVRCREVVQCCLRKSRGRSLPADDSRVARRLEHEARGLAIPD